MYPDLNEDRDFGHYSVGRGTYWDPTTEFRAYLETEKVVIGRYCSIAARATINTGGEHEIDLVSSWPHDNFVLGKQNPTRNYRVVRNTVIGHDVWIGFGAHIAKGAMIGHGAVIGARAVVVKDVPPYAIVVGNPGRILRYRLPPPLVTALLEIAWWDWPPALIAERIEDFHLPVPEFIAKYGTLPPEPQPKGIARIAARIFRSRRP